ncbi:histone-lysine N-methyltransferase, H3 lysine-36 specific-like [Stylophora pistillata]|uniref:histone-lysine N-methyltransferase, H3 lysine-36 specific-like n=1 Tax=Stylophora pistillata TaxID=50429 RepID=UPI000C04BD3B|nr:histone-lysine N-methyltransferase, H3 lysine-36 specific-like [Stylophora pistillata]
MYSKRLAVIEVTENFLSCRANEDIKEGSFLTDLWGKVSETATRYTVQVGKNKHVEPEGVIKYMNHSCDRKATFIYKRRKDVNPFSGKSQEVFWFMVAACDIKKGEDITFDYNVTEYEVAERFRCNCGAVKCLGEIKGFKFLTPEQQKSRESELSPVLKKLWQEP